MTIPFDIVLGYGCGGGLALAARRSLARMPTPTKSRYFAVTALFSATVYAPTGLALYMQYPDWMLMYLANPAHLSRAFMLLLVAFSYFFAPLAGFLGTYRLMGDELGRHMRASFLAVFALLATIVLTGRERMLTVAYYDAYHGGGPRISIFESPLLLAVLVCSIAIVGLWIFLVVLVRRHAARLGIMPDDSLSATTTAHPLAERLGLSGGAGPSSEVEVKPGQPVGGDVRS